MKRNTQYDALGNPTNRYNSYGIDYITHSSDTVSLSIDLDLDTLIEITCTGKAPIFINDELIYMRVSSGVFAPIYNGPPFKAELKIQTYDQTPVMVGSIERLYMSSIACSVALFNGVNIKLYNSKLAGFNSRTKNITLIGKNSTVPSIPNTVTKVSAEFHKLTWCKNIGTYCTYKGNLPQKDLPSYVDKT